MGNPTMSVRNTKKKGPAREMGREKKRKNSNTEKPAKGKTKARTGYRKPKREEMKKEGQKAKGSNSS